MRPAVPTRLSGNNRSENGRKSGPVDTFPAFLIADV
jgi:hypothetical protein